MGATPACLHEGEGIVVEVAVVVHVRLHAPVVVQAAQQRVPREEAAEVPAPGTGMKFFLPAWALHCAVGQVCKMALSTALTSFVY